MAKLSADMKRFITFVISFLTFCIVWSCISDSKHDTQDVVMQEFYLADLSGQSNDYDRLIFKDENHVILTDHYESGIVREYYIVNEKDTLSVGFSDNGFPLFMTNGHLLAIFGDYSEHSVLMGIIEESGEYEIVDIETEHNWIEYQNTVRGGVTRATEQPYELEHIQTLAWNELYTKILEKTSGIDPGIASGYTWCAIGIAYTLSDNPKYLATVEFISKSLDYYFNFSYGYKIGYAAIPEGEVFLGITGGALVVANAVVWKHNFNLIYQGIKNGDFSRLPIVQEPEMFPKLIQGGIWFDGPSSAKIDWQAQKVSVGIKLGLANFNYLDNPSQMFEIGVRSDITLPKDWKAYVEREGNEYHLICSVTPNLTNSIIKCSIPVYITGVYNIEDDIVYKIEQTPQIQVDPETVYFTSMNPIQVTVTSFSSEDWEVASWPDWLECKSNCIPTQAVNSLTLTPKRLEGESPGVVVLSVTSFGRTGHYEKEISVYPYSKEKSEPYIYKNRVLCPDGNHPHAIDLGLSVKWACCDVGASTPLDRGDYFAWGETETKEYITENFYPATYTISDYKWYKVEQVPGVGTLSGYTKYCIDPAVGYDGFTDGKTTLDLADDAAHANWGGGWRMPTKEELDELNRECSWYNSHNLGYGGGLATGPSGNSIYMTNKGCYGPTFYFTYGWYHANYWTSSLSTTYNSWADGYPAWGVEVEKRCVGQAVRPVHD